jgi:uncharacterized membrane protein
MSRYVVSQKLGYVLIALSLITAVVLVALISSYQQEAEQLGCYTNSRCDVLETQLDITHFITGILGFLLSLGVYISFFHTDEEEIKKRLSRAEQTLSDDERYDWMTRKEHGAIKQAQLRHITEYSKSKVSEAISYFEKKKLIQKEKTGRTNKITYTGP